MTRDASAGGVNDALLAELASHPAADDTERAHLAEIRAFVAAHRDPFDRAHLHAHLTASAIVVDAEGLRVALGHHRKLDRWLQPGGHGEPGDTDGLGAALREAFEETGIAGLRPHPHAPRPLDVDVHEIPARGGVPRHLHLDLRYLVQAPAGAVITRSEQEHHAMRWFAWREADALELDAPLLRALAKARRWAGA